MKLIRELAEDLEYIKEEKDGKENLYLKGIYAQAEVGNRNKRMYPLATLEREVNRYVTENVQRSTAYGELGHPSGPNINLDRTAILIREMRRDGNNFMGKALVASTPMGQIVKGLITDGARLGVSTRALGSVKLNEKTGLNEVQDDLRLLAVDVVADPSGPDCWTDAITEGAEYIYNIGTGKWEEYVDGLRKKLQKTPANLLEEEKNKVEKAMLSFINNLKTI